MRRTTRRLLLVAISIAGLAILDRSGVFGHNRNDHHRYHRRECQVLRALAANGLELAIHDGDTYATQVRLIGLDSTIEGMHSATAHEFLHKLAVGQRVQLELEPDRTRDRSGNLMAYVYLQDDLLLNAHLLETGHARADTRVHTRSRDFIQLQNRAKRQGHGIWAQRQDP